MGKDKCEKEELTNDNSEKEQRKLPNLKREPLKNN